MDGALDCGVGESAICKRDLGVQWFLRSSVRAVDGTWLDTIVPVYVYVYIYVCTECQMSTDTEYPSVLETRRLYHRVPLDFFMLPRSIYLGI